MIISKNIKLNLTKPFTNEKIEKSLCQIGVKALRWAVLKVKTDCIIIGVSYEK